MTAKRPRVSLLFCMYQTRVLKRLGTSIICDTSACMRAALFAVHALPKLPAVALHPACMHTSTPRTIDVATVVNSPHDDCYLGI